LTAGGMSLRKSGSVIKVVRSDGRVDKLKGQRIPLPKFEIHAHLSVRWVP